MINKLLNSKSGKRIKKILSKEEIRILPGSIAFSLVLSIVPTILFLIFMCSKFNISIVGIIEILDEIIPKDVIKLLNPIVSSGMSGIDISVWYIIIGLILASNGTDAIVLASNELYKTEKESYVKRRVKSLIMIIVIGIVFSILLFVVAFGNNILKFILDLPALINVKDNIYKIFIILKWPIAILIISILIKIIYTIAPNKRIPSKYTNKGVLFTTIGWVIITAIYTFYTNNIANYNIFYGSLSSLIILMVWIYVLSYVLVLGIAINASIYELENKN